jgi:hypothetical protein
MNTPSEIFLVDRLLQVPDHAIRQSASPVNVVGVGSREDCRNRVARFNQVSRELSEWAHLAASEESQIPVRTPLDSYERTLRQLTV